MFPGEGKEIWFNLYEDSLLGFPANRVMLLKNVKKTVMKKAHFVIGIDLIFYIFRSHLWDTY